MFDYQFRIILVGDSMVGKSSLVKCFSEGVFHSHSQPDPTVGVDFFARIIKLVGGARVKLQLWDTAGQEKFKSITRAYYRNSVAALLTFDITNRASFDHLQDWFEECRAGMRCAAPVFLLVGHKLDMAAQRQVSSREARHFAAHMAACVASGSSSPAHRALHSLNTTTSNTHNTKNTNNNDNADNYAVKEEEEEDDEYGGAPRQSLDLASEFAAVSASHHSAAQPDKSSSPPTSASNSASNSAAHSSSAAPFDYIETSALTGQNVEQAFQLIAERIYSQMLLGCFQNVSLAGGGGGEGGAERGGADSSLMTTSWDGIKQGFSPPNLFLEPPHHSLNASPRNTSSSFPGSGGCC